MEDDFVQMHPSGYELLVRVGNRWQAVGAVPPTATHAHPPASDDEYDGTTQHFKMAMDLIWYATLSGLVWVATPLLKLIPSVL